MELSDDVKKKLESEHGNRLVSIPIPESKWGDAACVVVCKRPSRAEYKRYRSMIFQEDQREGALESLTRACVVHPPAAEFQQLVEDRPALCEKIGGVLTDVAGGIDLDAKKF